MNKKMFTHLFIFINKTQYFNNTYKNLSLSKKSNGELDDPGNKSRNIRWTRRTTITRGV